MFGFSEQHRALLRYGAFLIKSLRRNPDRLPYELRFTITQRCDGHCRMCGVWRRPESSKRELSLDVMERAACSMSDHVLWLGLSGGEPTIRDDYPEIVTTLVAALPKLILLKVHTNGLNPDRVLERVTPTLAAKVPFHLMIVSLDALGEEHDRIRGYPGAFKRVIETSDRLIALERDNPHFQVAFETTISPYNREQISAVSAYIARHYPGHVHINTLAEDGVLVGRGAHSADFAGKAELPAIRKLAASLSFNNPKNLVPLAYLGLVERFFNDGGSPIECLAGRDMIGVDTEGGVRACDYRPEALGNLAQTDGDLVALLKSPDVRRQVNELATCRACFSPCSAFPSMLRTPQVIMYGLMKSLSYRLRDFG